MTASAPTVPDTPVDTPIDAREDTAVARFVRAQVARIEQVSAAASSETMQNAVFGALLDDFGHQLGGALGALLGYYRDPETALGPLLVTIVTSMQQQPAGGRA